MNNRKVTFSTGSKIRRTFLSVLFIITNFTLFGQNAAIEYNAEIDGVVSNGEHSPFWLQNRQYGKISTFPNSFNVTLGINKDFSEQKKLFDYGFKASALLQNDKIKANVYFHELYAKARFWKINMTIGSREEHLGNQDSTLSCGGLFFSHNARPMPKISLGIENFTPVPLTKGLLEIKGALVHGWFNDNIFVKDALLHHKYVYARIGGKLPVHFQYGLDHVAQWGGYSPTQGQQPVSLTAYKSIFLGGKGGSDANISDQINALGNHIISQSTRIDIDISDFKICGYWQNISEDGPVRLITKTMNLPDGLWGFSIKNKKFPFVKGILYEYLNTTDQSGPYHDKDGIVYGGNDTYFNNGTYQSGWTYFSRTIGTPFITSPIYNENGEINPVNTRVQIHHIGIEGDVTGFRYKFLSSFSKNYGSYNQAYSEMKPATSLLLEVNKILPKLYNIEISCSLGADFGKMYGNSTGCLVSIRKTGDLFRY